MDKTVQYQVILYTVHCFLNTECSLFTALFNEDAAAQAGMKGCQRTTTRIAFFCWRIALMMSLREKFSLTT